MDHSLTLCFLFFVWISQVTAQGVSIEGCPILPVRLGVPNQDDSIIGTWTEPTANAERIFRSHIPGQAMLPVGFHDIIYEFQNTATGEEGSCTFLFIVFWFGDDQPPQIQNCPGEIVRTLSAGASTVTVSWNVPTAIDNAGPFMSTSSHVPPFDFPVGVHTVTYTFEDTRGLTSICEFNVMVTGIDMELPVINCPENQLENAVAGAATWFVSWPAVTATDDSLQTPQLISSSPSSLQGLTGGTFPVGRVTTVRYDYADGSGNVASCMFDVTVNAFVDMDPPMIRCSDSDVRRVASGSDAVVVWTVPTIEFDASLPVQIVSNFESGETFPIGTELVEYTFTDAVGNVAVCSFNVIVEDITPPVFQNCPQIDIMDTLTVTETSKRIEWQTIVAVDNSNGMTFITGTHESGQFFFEGTTEVTLTARDESNNMATCQFRVVLTRDTENEPPVVMNCPMPIIEIAPGDQSGSTVSWAEPRAQDDDGIPTRGRTHVPPELFPIGITDVEYTFTDSGGLVASCRFTVTILDQTPPQIFGCPQVPITATLLPDGSETPISFTPPTATDNSLGIVTTSSTHNPGETFPLGTTPVTYQFRDESGNIDQCEFAVIVSDLPDLIQPEIFNCPDDITQQASGTGQELVRWPPITATDDSGVPPMLVLGPPNFQDFFTPGTSEGVTYLFQDAAGNANTCTFRVTVVNRPTLPPVVNCTGRDIVETAMFGVSSVFVTLPTCSATDDSGQAIFVSQTPPSGFFGLGSMTVINIFADADGNRGFGTFTVTVNPEVDNEPPVVNCDGLSFSRTVPAGTQSLVIANLPTCTATDNSGTVLPLPQNPPPGTQFPVGPTVVGNTFEDPSGNRATGVYTVTIIEDRPRLQIICPTNAVAQCQTNSNAIIGLWSDPDCTGGVQPRTTSCNPSSGSDISSVQTLASCTCVDNAGETETCFFNLPAAENIPPTVDCSGLDMTRMAPSGASGVTVLLPSCRASDNSGTVLPMNQFPRSGSFFTIGSTTVINTFEDACGNTATDTFIVTVNPGVENLVMNCPTNAVAQCQINSNAIIGLWSDPDCTGGVQPITTRCNPSSGSDISSGQTFATCTCEDNAGETETCFFNLPAAENIPPVVDCSGLDMTRMAPFGASGVTVLLPSCRASDNSGTVLPMNQSPRSGSFFTIGSTTVINTFEDACGNTATDTFIVTVNPEIRLVDITCPSDGTGGNEVAPGTFIATWSNPICTGSSGTLSTSCDPASGTPVGLGTTVVRCSCTDVRGQRDECTFAIFNADVMPPSVDCSGRDEVVMVLPPARGATVMLPSCEVSDNSGSSSLVRQSPTSGSFFPLGTTPVTNEYADDSGNRGSDVFTVTVVVVDIEGPDVTCADILRTVPFGQSGAIVQLNTCTAVDNSGRPPSLLSYQPTSGSFFPIGSTEVRVIFLDDAGNSGTDTFNVIVQGLDGIDPSVNCAGRDINADTTGSCAVVSFAPCTATDNSGVPPVLDFQSHQSGDCFPVGTTAVVFTFRDGAGNTGSGSFDIVVTRDTAPVLLRCPDDITDQVLITMGGGIVQYDAPIAFDESGSVQIINDVIFVPGSFFPLGTTPVTYVFSDPSGNTVECSFSVTLVGVNPCSSRICQNGGVCQAMSLTDAACVCSGCFTGSTCQISTGACNLNSCSNGGVCIPFADSCTASSCDCPRCFSGLSCQTRVSACRNHECLNGASCIPDPVECDQYTCECLNCFRGEFCAIAIPDPCSSTPCLNGGQCIRRSDSCYGFFCACQTGFSGERCESSVNILENPCNNFPCENDGSCVSSGSVYKCLCRDGYTGINCRQQTGSNSFFDQCVSSPCANGGSCFNSYSTSSGSLTYTPQYTCVCPNSYTGERCTVLTSLVPQLNRCQSSNICQNGGTCLNSYCSFDDRVDFFCDCPIGFIGEVCTIPYGNPCSTIQCSNGGTCVPFNQYFVCECRPGFSGSTCGLLGDVIPPTISGCPQQTIVVQASPGASSAQVSWPTPQVSDNSGGPVQLVSVNAVSGAFYGVGTNQEVEYVYEDVSGNRNSCSFFIIVTQGTSTGCQLNPCLNDGTCRQVAGVDSCICPPGFTGQTCSQRTNPCSSTPCQNGGTCVQISVTGFLCQCPNQFEGDRCQTNTLVTCASQPCENGGTCVQIAASSILCLCTGQFEGDRCQNGNPCNSFPCLNGGTCIPSANAPDFFCICRANLQGPLCQQALLDTTAPNIAGCPGNITVTSFTSNYEQVTWQVPTATDASPPVTRTETHFPGVFISRGQTINVIYHFTDAFTNTAVCSFFIVAPV